MAAVVGRHAHATDRAVGQADHLDRNACRRAGFGGQPVEALCGRDLARRHPLIPTRNLRNDAHQAFAGLVERPRQGGARVIEREDWLRPRRRRGVDNSQDRLRVPVPYRRVGGAVEQPAAVGREARCVPGPAAAIPPSITPARSGCRPSSPSSGSAPQQTAPFASSVVRPLSSAPPGEPARLRATDRRRTRPARRTAGGHRARGPNTAPRPSRPPTASASPSPTRSTRRTVSGAYSAGP